MNRMTVVVAMFFLMSTFGFAGEKADDTLTIISIPEGAQVEWNRKVIGVTPLTNTIGEYAFNSRKSTIFSKKLRQPVVIRVSKDGYITKEVDISKQMMMIGANGRPLFYFYILTSNHFEINLDKISAKLAALTNADIVKLHEAEFSDELIIDKISNTPSAYSLEMDDLVSLRKSGISDPVIQAMMHAK